jgi:hypothetical protein
METSHRRFRKVELDANRFVEDSFVYPAQIVESDYSINITVTRDMSEYVVEVLVLLVCESTDGAGAIP